MQRQTVFEKQQLPALDSETRFVRIDEVFVIGVHNDLEAKQHGAILAKKLHNRQELELHRCIIDLVFVKSARVTGDDLVFLHHDATKLLSTCISVDVEREVKVRERQQQSFCKCLQDGAERVGVALQPCECDFGARKAVQRCT